MNIDDVMKQALAALEDYEPNEAHKVAVALRAAIEQSEKRWVKSYAGGKPNYTVPEEKQQPIGHADLDINNIYIFSALEDRRIPVGRTPLYTAPRQWQGLTDEDVKSIWRDIDGSEGLLMRFARAIEEKLKERNSD